MHHKCGTRTGIAGHINATTVLLDEFFGVVEANAHAHAPQHASSAALRGEERLENPVLQMPGNTGTTVLDADVNTGSIVPGLDGESLNRLPDHRLGGVANDISKNLIQLSRDTPYQGQIILKLPLFFNLELEERLTVEEKTSSSKSLLT